MWWLILTGGRHDPKPNWNDIRSIRRVMQYAKDKMK